MSFAIDKTVTAKAPKKPVVSQFTGNNSNSRQRAFARNVEILLNIFSDR
jgi:hypothetical protein